MCRSATIKGSLRRSAQERQECPGQECPLSLRAGRAGVPGTGVSAQLKTLALESAEEQECSGTRSGSDAAGVRRPEAGGHVPCLVGDVAGLLRKHVKDERRATVATQMRFSLCSIYDTMWRTQASRLWLRTPTSPTVVSGSEKQAGYSST